jgi:lysophospholipase L1-like esterase
MRQTKWLWVLTAVLATALLLSLAANGFIYRQARQYYIQLNGIRLDPLGLSYFAGDAVEVDEERVTAVFLGDSRAEYWPAPDNQPSFQFINRGISSQTSVQVQMRFEEQIRPFAPNILILQVGINDLTRIPVFPDLQDEIMANCKENIRWLVEQSTAMGTTVVLTTVFPTGDVPLARRPFWSGKIETAVLNVNDTIRSLASERVIVLDAFAVLADEDGRLRDEYAIDQLHLNDTGYKVLNRELQQILQEIVIGN